MTSARTSCKSWDLDTTKTLHPLVPQQEGQQVVEVVEVVVPPHLPQELRHLTVPGAAGRSAAESPASAWSHPWRSWQGFYYVTLDYTIIITTYDSTSWVAGASCLKKIASYIGDKIWNSLHCPDSLISWRFLARWSTTHAAQQETEGSGWTTSLRAALAACESFEWHHMPCPKKTFKFQILSWSWHGATLSNTDHWQLCSTQAGTPP